MKVLLLVLFAVLLQSCASSYASKCSEWQHKSSSYELRIGAVDRVDIYRCTGFSEVP
jgi:hypothetical protein